MIDVDQFIYSIEWAEKYSIVAGKKQISTQCIFLVYIFKVSNKKEANNFCRMRR